MIDFDFLLLFLFIFFSFFCSGSESAFFSLTEVKIEDIKRKHPKRGTIISYLLENPQKLLISILIYNTFANIFITLISSRIFVKYFPDLQLWLVILIPTFLILIFGEVTPKSLAINITTIVSLTVAPFWYISIKILTPLIFVFTQISKVLVRINSFLFFKNIKEEKEYKTDEVIEAIKESRKHGIIGKEEEIILGNVIEFANADIWELMRPRNEIFSISTNTLVVDVIDKIKERKFSRIPIWENSEENIIGILYTKELLKLNTLSKRKLSYYKDILKPPLYIPESMKAEKLLRHFQTTQNHLAIVIDEYGGITGLITLEDVLEAIIGDVVDKDDIKPLYYRYNTYMIEIEAKIEISEFNTVFRTNIKSNEAATVGGYLLEKIKRIPKAGEIFNIDTLQFKISGALPNKIEKIVVTKLKKLKK